MNDSDTTRDIIQTQKVFLIVISAGSITREVVDGRIANVLRGKVSLENNGGFVQMATDLALDPSVSRTVDMSEFDGVELDVIYLGEKENESFNLQ